MNVFCVFQSGSLVSIKTNKLAAYNSMVALLPVTDKESIISYSQFTRVWNYKGSFQHLTTMGLIINIKLVVAEKK